MIAKLTYLDGLDGVGSLMPMDQEGAPWETSVMNFPDSTASDSIEDRITNHDEVFPEPTFFDKLKGIGTQNLWLLGGAALLLVVAMSYDEEKKGFSFVMVPAKGRKKK